MVIGGSAGAIAALRELLAALPAPFPAAIVVVVHISPDSPALLGKTLARRVRLPIVSAQDGMKVEPDRVIVGMPDLHLTIVGDSVRLTHGPRENRHRPSIDVLFRSAAVACGPRVIGVVLTGMLDDGAAGLWAVKRRGGIAMVQDPAQAEYPEMPRNAIEATDVDVQGSISELARHLSTLAGSPVIRPTGAVPPDMDYEVGMAIENKSDMDQLDRVGRRTPFTCPECGGAMWELDDARTPRFRCHVGHAYSIHSFASEQSTRVEATLWAALRSLEENEHLARRLAERAGSHGNQRSERYHIESAMESAAHADVLRSMLAGLRPTAGTSGTEEAKATSRK